MNRKSKFVSSLSLGILLAVLTFGLLGSSTKASATGTNSTTGTSSKSTPVAENMEVHFIDVGQGDATLIKCGDASMLIDAGDNTKGTVVQLYLKKQNIKKLNYLILTHPDADHIGGADVIITKYTIGNVFMSDYTKDNKTYKEVLDALAYKRMKWSTPSVGSTYQLGKAKITILAPNKKYSDPNDSSIALTVTYGKTTFLFTGDAEEAAEKDILANKYSVNADVYQVGHHGSKTSTSDALLKKSSPTYAVISCGEKNTYGHPDAETLNKLRSAGVKVFRTDEQGSILAKSDGKEITWDCAPSDTWQAGESTQSSTNAKSTVESKPTTDNTPTQSNDGVVVAPVPTPDTSAVSEPVQEQAAPVAATDDMNRTVHITKTGEKYHEAGCSSLSKSDIEISLGDAISQGYTPCKKCH